LATRLNSSTLRQLKQRITLRHHLRPLTLAECREYIVNRLRSAGRDDGNVFRSNALEEIHQFAGGIPRLINVLCDNAMLTAFALGKPAVEFEMVREVAEDLNLTARTLNAHSTKINTVNDLGGSLPKLSHPTSVSSLKPSQPALTVRSVLNPIDSSTYGIVLPPRLLNDLTALLIDAMGPMGSVVLRDRLITLGESPDVFPNSKVGTLIDEVSHEILDQSMKQNFQRLAKARIAALT
jgi:hypothetical protein